MTGPTPRPLERLVMITNLLLAAGNTGRPAGALAAAVGFRGTVESQREQLARAMRDLQSVGVAVRNVSPAGVEAVWVLTPGDSRIRLALSAQQQAELARAALLARRPGPVGDVTSGGGAAAPTDVAALQLPRPPVDLDQVLRGLTARCELRFTYNGKPRQVSPVSLQQQGSDWVLTGVDATAGADRRFTVARMTNLSIGPAGSAAPVDVGRHEALDPLTWAIDEPTTATLQIADGFEADVTHLLGEPDLGPGRYIVTNRWVFFARLVELGERVRLTGSPELRRDVATRLRAVLA